MGRNSHKKRALNAQITRNFFAQVPRPTSPAHPPSTTVAVPTLPAESIHPLAGVLGAGEQKAAQQTFEYISNLGQELLGIYLANKASFREELIEAFTCAYSYVNYDSRSISWGVDTDLLSLIADQLAEGEVIGLFTNGAVKSGIPAEDLVVTAPAQLTEYDVISLVVDALLELVERSTLETSEQHRQDGAFLPIFALALIRITATSRCLYTLQRPDKDLWLVLRQVRYPKMETINNLVVPGASPLTEKEWEVIAATVRAMGGDPTNRADFEAMFKIPLAPKPASDGDIEEEDDGPPIELPDLQGSSKPKVMPTSAPDFTEADGFAASQAATDEPATDKGKGKGRERVAFASATATASATTAKAAGVEIPRIDAGKVKGVHLKAEAARSRLRHHIQKLLEIDHPSIEARREAFTRALEDITKSETYKDAKKPERAERERRRRPSLHHVDRTTLKTTSFPIGTEPGWLGELERMQGEALRKDKTGGEDNKHKHAEGGAEVSTKVEPAAANTKVEPTEASTKPEQTGDNEAEDHDHDDADADAAGATGNKQSKKNKKRKNKNKK
ncbi:hypothetical protein A1O3_09940 [Capronia epimyces CBS 606.96]|uniref:Uncharacterized protein n=1 Tax=Capronia epimyces CBS 606.96 TaxID=1182542 RepID=W9XL58_9EURO|nr:uncharacterized protein A1O3_09940 [Capronia epimyces CBS 606.96]EXJ77711.1 hypothetical protein A1O3_09940 [Capronia epimyces CBS 606.96]